MCSYLGSLNKINIWNLILKAFWNKKYNMKSDAADLVGYVYMFSFIIDTIL